jgi:hypothetical protein
MKHNSFPHILECLFLLSQNVFYMVVKLMKQRRIALNLSYKMWEINNFFIEIVNNFTMCSTMGSSKLFFAGNNRCWTIWIRHVHQMQLFKPKDEWIDHVWYLRKESEVGKCVSSVQTVLTCSNRFSSYSQISAWWHIWLHTSISTQSGL